MKGRPPKPHALKVLQSNPGKRKLRVPNITPPGIGGLPLEAPAHMPLTDEGRDEWRRLVSSMGHCCELDSLAFAIYCQTIVDYAVARKALKEAGHVAVGSQGQPIISPESKLVSRIAAELLKLADALGVTPVGRIRLHLPAKPTPQADVSAKFFGPNN